MNYCDCLDKNEQKILPVDFRVTYYQAYSFHISLDLGLDYLISLKFIIFNS